MKAQSERKCAAHSICTVILKRRVQAYSQKRCIGTTERTLASACARADIREEFDDALRCKTQPRRLGGRVLLLCHTQRDDRQRGMGTQQRAVRCVERRGPGARAAIVLRARIAGRLIAIHGRVLNEYPHMMFDTVSLGDRTLPIEVLISLSELRQNHLMSTMLIYPRRRRCTIC